MRNILAFVTVLLVFSSVGMSFAQTEGSGGADSNVIDHGEFSRLLNTFVDQEGAIAYDRWHRDEEAMQRLDAYIESISDAEVGGHNRDSKLAFYLNAYNALVIDEILDRWPVDSPKHIDGFFDGLNHTVAGSNVTLDELEHKIIRPEFDEARIHFVLVCAAKSCPRLRQVALTAQNLEGTLESAAREFVPRVTEIEESGTEESSEQRTVVTSRLFDWFASDFEESAGSVREYLKMYADDEVAKALAEGASIEFHSYDWAINSQS